MGRSACSCSELGYSDRPCRPSSIGSSTRTRKPPFSRAVVKTVPCAVPATFQQARHSAERLRRRSEPPCESPQSALADQRACLVAAERWRSAAPSGVGCDGLLGLSVISDESMFQDSPTMSPLGPFNSREIRRLVLRHISARGSRHAQLFHESTSFCVMLVTLYSSTRVLT